MKIAVIIVRVLMGLLLLFASVVVLFKLVPQPETTGAVKTFNEGIAASGYLMTLIKVTELICAIAFLSGFFVPLAAIVLFPISINILFFHSLLAPEGIPVAIALFAGNLFLAYTYRHKYKPLFEPK